MGWLVFLVLFWAVWVVGLVRVLHGGAVEDERRLALVREKLRESDTPIGDALWYEMFGGERK